MMPFNRPTLAELIDRAISVIESGVQGANARLRRSNLNILARVISGCSHGFYGFLAWLAKQLFPDTAEDEYLDRMASLWLDEPRKGATFSIGQVTFPGTNGATLPSGTVMSRSDGTEYATTAESVVSGGSVTAPIEALVAGASGNIDSAGAVMTITTPVNGIQSSGIAGVLSSGSDIEQNESLRQRIKDRMKEPPHGGARNDYVTWAKEVGGVTRAWCYSNELGAGKVTVRFVRDDDADIIPDGTEVAAVQDYIDAASRRPVTAQVIVVAPIAAPQDYTISVSPNTAEVKAAVTAALEDFLKRKAIPHGAGHDGTIYLDDNRDAVKSAAGLIHYTMTYPAADVTLTTGQIATMGAITWG